MDIANLQKGRRPQLHVSHLNVGKNKVEVTAKQLLFKVTQAYSQTPLGPPKKQKVANAFCLLYLWQSKPSKQKYECKIDHPFHFCFLCLYSSSTQIQVKVVHQQRASHGPISKPKNERSTRSF